MDYIAEKFSLAGKKALVTGGAQGISYSIAEGLHQAGAEIVLFDLSDKVHQSAEELGKVGVPVHAVQGDLTDTEKLPDVYKQVLDKTNGRLDILINGAGIQYRCIAEDFPLEMWKKVIDINLSAVFYISQLAARTMIAQGSGRIVNIGSMCSYFGATMIPAYTASKGGILQLTKALSNEWASKGVNVNAIAPGYIVTELTANMKTVNPAQYEEANKRIPMGRWGDIKDMQGTAIFLCSEASAYITGVTIPVDGGYCGK